MFTRTVALALLLCFPAFAQPSARLLPVAEPSSPPLLSIDGDPTEHSVSWQFVGIGEGLVTGALLLAIVTMSARGLNLFSGGFTTTDNAILAATTASGATLFGAMGNWLGEAAREDDGGGKAARSVLISHGVLVAIGATGAVLLGVLAAMISRSTPEPLKSHP